MHMDNGIGRAGYRLLALVFFVVGLMGLGLQWVSGAPTDAAQWIGIATTVAALGVLFGLTLVVLAEPARKWAASEPASEPASETLEFEYPEPSARPAPAKATPARPAATEQPSMVTLRDRYTRETPMVREILTSSGQAQHKPVPEITARRVPKGARPEQAPAGTSMGRCGSCGTVIYAPTARPLRLRCPACSKVTLLK